MIKDVKFVLREGTMAEVLGIPLDRRAPVDEAVQKLVAEGKTAIEIIEYVRDNFDLTITEWTCFIYNFGVYVAMISKIEDLE